MRPLLYVTLTTLAGLVLEQLLHFGINRLGRRLPLAARLARRAHRPALLLTGLGGLALGLRLFVPPEPWLATVLRVLVLTLIGVAAWLLTSLLLVAEDTALSRYRTDVRDNRVARTIHTQVRLIRRVTAATVAVLAVGSMLLTLPAVRTVGASVLASAGLVGAVAALAAQSLLGNVLAGLQIAFGQSLRLDDVVVVEGEWGRVEEITLTYVVVRIWDDRRLILPTSYFTTKPFQNWTHSSAELTGSVEIDVDWLVPVDRLRSVLTSVLETSPQWDERTNVLQVTDAVGGTVRIRALVSAYDAPTLWDLRCLVRERLVTWLRDHHPDALPRTRMSLESSVKG
jgi:small-conductance mechanosensitive channel